MTFRGGTGVKARDMAMTLEEFRQYYDSHRGLISMARAYDAAGGRWVGVDRLFTWPGAYTLIVVKFKDLTFLRVDVKPSLQVRFTPKKYSSAATWKSLGVELTYGEKEYLGSINEKDLTIEELIKSVERSSFRGKDGLLIKLKRAAEKLKR
jgi:hypothetical protein